MATTAEEVKNLKKDITQIKNMLADQLADIPSNGLSQTVFNRDELQDMANRAGKSVREFVSDKREQINEASDKAETAIKERPFMTAAAMFASGVVLASLFARR